MDQIWTVATYNVHEWVGTDGRKDPGRVIRVIRDLEADILALQEASFQSGEARFTLKYLIEATGMNAVPGLTLFKKDADFGNMLLSRHPLKATRNLDLSVPGREPRGAIIAEFLIHNSSVTVSTTHLGLRSRERHIQIRRLAKELNPHGRAPLILLGDLNEWNPFSRVLKRIFSHFGRVSTIPTYPSNFPILALDRILVHPRSSLIKICVSKTALTRVASDHLPVKATIRLNPP